MEIKNYSAVLRFFDTREKLKNVISYNLNCSAFTPIDILKVRIGARSLNADLFKGKIYELEIWVDEKKLSKFFVFNEIINVDANVKEIVFKDIFENGKKNINSLADIKNSFLCENHTDIPENAKFAELLDVDLCDLAEFITGELGLLFYKNNKNTICIDEIGIKNGAPAARFNTDNFLEANVNISSPKNIKSVTFNAKGEDSADIYAQPCITLAIDPAPLSASPAYTKIWENEETGDKYMISPLRALARVYYSGGDDISLNFKADFIKNYTAIEEYDLKNEDFIRLSGHINKLNDIAIDDVSFEVMALKEMPDPAEINYFIKGTNVVLFSKKLSGRLKISYKTDIYRAVFGPYEREHAVELKAGLKNAELKYNFECVNDRYYPPNYTRNFNLITDFCVDPDYILGAKFHIDAGTASTVNAFGEVSVNFGGYGIKKITIDGSVNPAKIWYIAYFANEFTISENEIKKGQ